MTQRTLRLTLRPFKRSDAKYVFKWASDEEVSRYMTWTAHKSIEETRCFVDSIAGATKTNPYNWIISLNETGMPIGSIGSTEQNLAAKSCDVGYCLHRDYWHRGIMTEALTAVLSFLMYEEGFERITAYHNVLNPNSGKVMKKCGMRYEATKQVYLELKDEYITADCYAINK